MDRPRRSECTASQIDGEAGWWITSGKIGLPTLARIMGVGRQQHANGVLGIVKYAATKSVSKYVVKQRRMEEYGSNKIMYGCGALPW